MAPLLLQPILRFTVHDDGTLAVLSPWFERVLLSEELLGLADGRRLSVRGDELTIRCTNGGAVYALDAECEIEGARAAHLLRSWA